MNVFLFERPGPPSPWFYSEDPRVVVARAATGGPRPRGRLERLARGFKMAWWRAYRRAGPRLRAVLDWLNRRPEADGPLLRGLRSAPVVRLHHPARLDSRTACRAWFHYLSRRTRRELIASAWDLLLAGLSVPLMFLPGPNVIGFWFLWRATSHWLAVHGAWRVRRRRVVTELVPLAVLDPPLDSDEQAARVAEVFGLKHLAIAARRVGRRPVVSS